MRQLSPVLTLCVVLGSLAFVGCSRPATPAPAADPSPGPAPAAAPAVAPAQSVTPAEAPAPAQLAEPPSAAVAPVAAVDRGPWGDPQWSGVNDAPALLDRVRARLVKEAPWLAAGIWQRRGRVVTRVELSAQPSGAEFRHAGDKFLLSKGVCRLHLPQVQGSPDAPQFASCTDFQLAQIQLGVWLWLLARGPDQTLDVQVEMMKLAPERGEADLVLFSEALGSRVRLGLGRDGEWLRIQRPDKQESILWNGRTADLTATADTTFRLEPATRGQADQIDARGWMWMEPLADGEVDALQDLARRSRTVMEGFPRYRLIRGKDGFGFAQIGAPVDAAPDGVQVFTAPPPRPPLAVVLMKERSDAMAWLTKHAPADVHCFDLMPRGEVSGTNQQAVVIAPCEGLVGPAGK